MDDPSPMDRVVFTVHDRVSDEQQVAYSRACHDEDEWSSAERARTSLHGGYYEDKEKFRVRKWLVQYTLVNGDVE